VPLFDVVHYSKEEEDYLVELVLLDFVVVVVVAVEVHHPIH
jgi:hypothetical protein